MPDNRTDEVLAVTPMTPQPVSSDDANALLEELFERDNEEE